MGRNRALDYLKVCLAAMVVGIHGGFFTEIDPKIAHVLIDYVFRIGVPIFFMINGFYAARIIGDAEKFLKWANRIAMLFAFWTLFYTPYFLSGVVDFKSFTYVLFVGFFHLWYLPATLAAGGLLHLFRRLSQTHLIILIAAAFAVGIFMQYAGNYHIFKGTQFDQAFQYYPIYRNFLCFGFPFFGMGYLIAKHGLTEALPKSYVNEGLILGVVLMGLEYGINQAFHIREGLDILWSLPVICGFIFLKALQSTQLTTSHFADSVSGLIYFLHPWLLKQLEGLGLHAKSFNVILVIGLVILFAPILIRLNSALRSRTGIAAL